MLVDDIDNAYDKVRHLGFKLADKVEFITKIQLQHLLDTQFLDSVHPWGWDLSLKGELERLGVAEIMLPTDDILNKVRELSNREWAAKHLQRGVEYVTELAHVKDLIRSWGKVIIKAPWSSSGRGVKYVSAEDFRTGGGYPTFERWMGNIIFRQGGVTAEPYYNKAKDFGMEFEMRDGKMVYRGLSLFDTIKNAYSGNVLASEEDKIEMLASFIDRLQLENIRQRIIDVLEPVLKDIYSGPLGVDMMICSRDENSQFSEATKMGYGVVDCIELNLRRTMGHVALALAEHLKTSDIKMKVDRNNIMRVEYDGNRYHLRVLPGKPSEDAPLH
mgnify:FL=1